MTFRTFVVSLAVDVRVEGWRGPTAGLVGGGEHEGGHICPVHQQARREGGGRRTPAARLVQACASGGQHEGAGGASERVHEEHLFDFICTVG